FSVFHFHLHSFPTRRSSDLSFQISSVQFSGRKFHLLFLTLPSETISKSPIKKLWKKIRVSLGAFGCPSDKRAIITVQGNQMHQRSEEHTSELQSPDQLVCRL